MSVRHTQKPSDFEEWPSHHTLDEDPDTPYSHMLDIPSRQSGNTTNFKSMTFPRGYNIKNKNGSHQLTAQQHHTATTLGDDSRAKWEWDQPNPVYSTSEQQDFVNQMYGHGYAHELPQDTHPNYGTQHTGPYAPAYNTDDYPGYAQLGNEDRPAVFWSDYPHDTSQQSGYIIPTQSTTHQHNPAFDNAYQSYQAGGLPLPSFQSLNLPSLGSHHQQSYSSIILNKPSYRDVLESNNNPLWSDLPNIYPETSNGEPTMPTGAFPRKKGWKC